MQKATRSSKKITQTKSDVEDSSSLHRPYLMNFFFFLSLLISVMGGTRYDVTKIHLGELIQM